MLGAFLTDYCEDGPDGYVVCSTCTEMISSDNQKPENKEIEKYITSIPSGKVDKQAIFSVAGTVWNRVYGSWPSSIKIKVVKNKNTTDSKKR